MLKSLSSYQFYKFIEESIYDKNKNNLILEPLCVIYRLALLQYKEKGTKLSVKIIKFNIKNHILLKVY